MTVFTYDLGIATAARFLDVFFLRLPGDEFVHRLALAKVERDCERLCGVRVTSVLPAPQIWLVPV